MSNPKADLLDNDRKTSISAPSKRLETEIGESLYQKAHLKEDYFPIHMIVASIFLIVVGVCSNNVLFQSEFFTESVLVWSTLAGYGGKHFAGVLFGTLAFPLGLLMLMFFSVHGMKSHYNYNLKIGIFSCLFVASLILCGVAYDQGSEVLDCGILFCLAEVRGQAYGK